MGLPRVRGSVLFVKASKELNMSDSPAPQMPNPNPMPQPQRPGTGTRITQQPSPGKQNPLGPQR
jgi:hypothetical protein